MKRAWDIFLHSRSKTAPKHPYNWTRLILPGLFLLGAFFLFFIEKSAPALAQDTDGLTMTVKAGFDGKYKDGGWIPIHVTLENNGADLQGVIKIYFTDTTSDSSTYDVPVELPSVSRKEITANIFAQSYSRNLQVSFISGKKILSQVKLQLDNFTASEYWFGIIASNPTTFNILTQFNMRNSTSRIIPLEIGDIPDQAQVLSPLDVLIFSGIDTGKLTSLQQQTLVTWVAGGGRLVVTGGTDWQKTAAGFLETGMLPLQPADSMAVKNLDDLQRFAHSPEPISELETGAIISSGNLTADAQVLSEAEGPMPLVLRRKYGAGEVLYLTFDPSMPPVKNWDGREAFFKSLFSNPLDKPSWLMGIRSWSQAKEAALTLPNLSLPSPLLICGFLFIYILALGPLNYLLVRFLKRSELGWVTIPVMVVFFSGMIILVGSLSRGSRVILNRLAIIQVWPNVSQSKIDGVVGIYSPTRSSYQAKVDAPTLLHPFPADFGVSTGSYSIQETGAATTISGLKLEISGITPLAFEGSTPAPTFSHNLEIILKSTNAVLLGSVTNSSELNLNGAVLLYPGGTVKIGDFPPGKTFDVQVAFSKAQLAGEPNLNPTFPFTTGYYGFPAPYATPSDTTVSDILGTTNFYDDREIYRKYSLLNAVTINNYGTGTSRGSGIYLVGWSDQLPIDVSLPNTKVTTQDNVLYFIAFQPIFRSDVQSLSQNITTLTPGTFNWSMVEGYDPSISPYNINIVPGLTFTMQYTPIFSVNFTGVKSLVLHLQGQASGNKATGFTIRIWNFDSNSWDEMDDLRWGDNVLETPESYVGAEGSVRVSFTSQQVSGLQISQMDFTAELER